jgi:hypothetical protein
MSALRLAPRSFAALALLAGLGLAAAAARAETVVEVRIAADGDDAEEEIATHATELEGSDLELGRDGSSEQLVGLRFPGVAIPGGAIIHEAWVQFEADEVQTGSVALTLRGETSDRAAPFAAVPANLSARPLGNASVAWSPAPWAVVGEQGPDQRTPSLVPIVQELVDAPTWTPDDALVLVVSGTGGRRSARSFDSVPTGAALLHVRFDPPANARPSLSITKPLPDSTWETGATVFFAATANDPESGPLDASIVWSSDRDGELGSGPSFSRSDLSDGVHQLSVSVADAGGGVTTALRRLTVFAPGNVLLAAGDIGDCEEDGDEATGALLETLPGRVLAVGDLAYPDGSSLDFESCFDPSWGPHRSRMHPVSGNHEWVQSGAAPYHAYFGAAAGTPGEGWYSFDYAGWHVVALSSDCDEFEEGCASDSPQGLWLEADLSANSKPCTLAFLHHPLFASLPGSTKPELVEFWQILYDHGVDVILAGHDHAYERFARMNPSGEADPERGPRSFVVGMGGAGLASAPLVIPHSEVRESETYGVLRLVLEPTGYSWEFVPVAGESFSDAGSEQCVFEAPVVTITSPQPGDVYAIGTSVPLAGTASDLEQGPLSAQLQWSSSRDGALGSGASLQRVLSAGTHLLTASVGDETGLLGSAQLSVAIQAAQGGGGGGGGGGCGLGPELAPLLVLLLAPARRRAVGRSRASRRLSPRAGR